MRCKYEVVFKAANLDKITKRMSVHGKEVYGWCLRACQASEVKDIGRSQQKRLRSCT